MLILAIAVSSEAYAADLDFSGLHAIAPLPVAASAPLDLSCLDGLCAAPAKPAPKPTAKPAKKTSATKKPAAKPATPIAFRWELRCQNGQCSRVLVPVVSR